MQEVLCQRAFKLWRPSRFFVWLTIDSSSLNVDSRAVVTSRKTEALASVIFSFLLLIAIVITLNTLELNLTVDIALGNFFFLAKALNSNGQPYSLTKFMSSFFSFCFIREPKLYHLKI